jgi:ABC-type uncharacterized transport system substrate-binding protein
MEFRWARGDFDRLPALAAELVRDRVAVIVAAGAEPSAVAAKAATSTIPILFVGGDPIKAGLVASLNRPGGNATGVYNLTNELVAKRLGLMHELFPGATLFGVLLDPKFPSTGRQAAELRAAASTIGQPLTFLNASTDAELDAALAALRQQRVAMTTRCGSGCSALSIPGCKGMYLASTRTAIKALPLRHSRSCQPCTIFANMWWTAG